MALDSFTQVTPVGGDTISARAFHGSVVFNNQLHVVMGQDSVGALGDMFSTKDGITWNRRALLVDTDGNTITARSFFGLCKHDNRVYLLCGYYGSASRNEVYVTSDMVHWTRLKGSNLTARSGFCTYSFDSRLWAIGGSDAASATNDVWWTKDGVRWTQEPNAPWGARSFSAGVVYNNSMYIMGGVGAARYNDVWYTKNGRNWTRIDPAANWSAREGHAVESMGSRLVLVGGKTDTSAYSGELFHSLLGNNWIEGDDSVPMATNIRGQSMDFFNNRLFSVGGVTDAATYNNGVWQSNGDNFKSAI
ncbi:MAG TPA: hypothetical protein VMV77_09280 [Bacteroidales bacterium]|nr:hypothetical protein [Bacteroidales bacterium]